MNTEQRIQYKFSIRNVGCEKCVATIQELAQTAGLHPVDAKLGELVLDESPTPKQLSAFIDRIEEKGFEIANCGPVD